MTASSFELLVEFTKDEDARTRATAIAGLAKVADPRGFAPVVVALFDPVDEVRTTAATALGIMKDERALEPLAECLKDSCEQAAATCAWALGQIPSTPCLLKLLDAIQDTTLADAVRTAAVTAVGERTEQEGSDLATSDELIEQTRAALLSVLADPCNELRATAIWTLGHLPADATTADACVTALEDPYEWCVRYAIEALAHIGGPQHVETLQRFALDQREEVRQLATQAIQMLS